VKANNAHFHYDSGQKDILRLRPFERVDHESPTSYTRPTTAFLDCAGGLTSIQVGDAEIGGVITPQM
jgi:hypothetical protein